MPKDLKAMRKAHAELRTKFNSKRTAFNALYDKAERSAEEETQLAAMNTELDALESQYRASETDLALEEGKARRDALMNAPSALDIPGRTARFQSFEPNPETTFGFKSLGEFAKSVMNANVQVDPRLLGATPSNTMVNQGGAGEGFLVPPDYSKAIWDLVFPGYGYDLMDLVTASPTEKNMVQLSKDETTPWGATGVQAAWRAENLQLNASKISLTGGMVPLHELYAFVVATQELLDDAPQLNDRLTKKASAAIRFKVSQAIMQGSGNGQPVGFMGAPNASLITQAKEAGQTNGTIVLNNVTKMYTRIPAGSVPNAVWLANIEILPQLVQLNVGTWPVWIPPNQGAAQAPGGYLLGRPVIWTEQALALGSPGDLNLVDPTGYFLANKAGGGVDFAASIHLFFDYNATAFRWIFRVGGQPYLSAPINPANGSLTKSHFVNLQQR